MKALYFFSILAIAANLLVPQKIVTYAPCCYGPDGALSVSSCCARKSARPTMHGVCCDPVEHQLRAAPAPAMDAAFEVRNLHACPVPQIPAFALRPITARLEISLDPAGADPPHPLLFSLHSRYNI